MGRKKSPGLFLRGDTWHIDKYIKGQGRLCESTGTGNLREAELHLARRLDESRQARVYGVRPQRTFRQAATKYLEETVKRSLSRDAQDLKLVDPYIGGLPLEQVHMGTLTPFIDARRDGGIKSATVNRTLAIVRRVLNLAARLWRDEHGLSWLGTPPMIQLVDWDDQRAPYPLDFDEQRQLLKALPPHLARMALFKVNVGAREKEVVGLRWEWEIQIPELKTSVFWVPDDPTGKHGVSVKNKEDRLLVLNRVARSVIEEVRGNHPSHVFTFRGKPVTRT